MKMMTKLAGSFVFFVALAPHWNAPLADAVSVESSSSAVPTAAPRIPDSALRLRNLKGVSGNWSGYVVEPSSPKQQNGTITSVRGSWVVPEVVPSVSDFTYSDIWVGIDGYDSNTVEQIGTAQYLTPNGPLYFAWYEMYPHGRVMIPDFPVQPGSVITASVSYLGNGLFELAISSQWNGVARSYSTIQSLKNAKRRSAEWIVEAPYGGGILPLADFGSVTFNNCALAFDGHEGGIADAAWSYEKLDMAVGAYLKAETSALLSPPAGFSVNWVSE